MRADTLSQVPDTHHAGAITTDQLALVGMDDDVIDGSSVDIVALETTSASIPHLNRPVLGAGDHPFALTVECDAGDVAGVTLKGHDRVGIGGLDVVELNIVVASSGKEALVRGDAEAIDLRVGVLNRA